jgi:hypothetical protein
VAVVAGRAEWGSNWSQGIERRWVGPEFYANRLQDWRLRDGRVECIEAGEQWPLRVLHLLTVELSPDPGAVEMRVRTGPVETNRPRSPGAWAGFLLGAGGRHVDYRLTALVHHRPGRDGGLVAVVDGTGRVSFRDNETQVHGTGRWNMGGKFTADELKEIPATSRTGAGFGEEPVRDVELCLQAAPAGDTYTLTLSARELRSKRVISQASLEHVETGLVDGGVGLVSHCGLDGSAVGHWFRNWQVAGTKVRQHPNRAYGPVLCTQYTLNRGKLKLTAQMPPLGPSDTQIAELQTRSAGGSEWKTVAMGGLKPNSFTIPFSVDAWDASRDVPCRVLYRLKIGPDEHRTYYWPGTIRKEPGDKQEFVLAAFTGNKHFAGDLQWNHDRIWFPHNDLVDAIAHHDPDALFFSGDQVYEGDLTPPQRRPLTKAMLDYLDRWYRWCWTFRDLARDRPCITIPDDHDVYHGNLWGAGGRHAARQDDGGYIMPPAFVNMVQETQTSHLPDPVDPEPVGQGIGVYFTRIDYGGISFAVIEDRKFKSSPTMMVPAGKVDNGWFQSVDFDPAAQADVPGAKLLGERQLRFLNDWSIDFSGGVWMKVMLSQTIFANVATVPSGAKSDTVVPRMKIFGPAAYPPNDRLAADADSNSWPQSARNRALRAIRRGFALHVAGDQHLGSFVHYGVDQWDDASCAFCVPSIANAWPRRWFPPTAGRNHMAGRPRYTGQYRDGFGNLMHVHAVANPRQTGCEPTRLHDRAPGYGIVRLRRAKRDIVVECWPRSADPAMPNAQQYTGWPITIQQMDNYGRAAEGYLPRVEVTGLTEPVVRVVDERTGEIIYALRIAETSFRPKIFGEGPFTVEVGEPDTSQWQTIRSLRRTDDPRAVVRIKF